ncbi:MAG: LicD family protein [Prevotellaceae bacterium]|nr:LicD family protein [Prevotellaceae bacterium]
MQEDLSKYNEEGTLLRKAQLRMLDILLEVDKICKKHNIPYWLDWGTLLGAVRHGGFIPWDDDLDIALMRKDHKLLCRVLKKELPDNLAFQDASTDECYCMKFAKVRDKNSFLVDTGTNLNLKYQGVFIDIFCYEKGSRKIKTIVDFFYGRAFRRLKHITKSRLEYIIGCLIWIPSVILVQMARNCNFLVGKNNLILSYGISSFTQHCKKDIFPLKSIVFENHEFMAPANPDGYLKRAYGDYMQIPPEEKRSVHSNKIELYE